MIFDFNDGWTLTKENGESFSVCLPHDAMLDEKRWRLTRDLSLLALASYKGKSGDAKNTPQVPAEPDQEGGKNL